MAVSGPLEPLRPDQDVRSWSLVAMPLVFEPLVILRPNGEMLPVLAGKAEWSGSNIRVWLRSDARFSDGSPVTFGDVEASLKKAGLRATQDGDAILVSATATAAPTELTLARAFVFRLTGDKPVGTGAFVVAEQDTAHILLRRAVPVPGRVGLVRLDSYATPQDSFAHTLKGDAELLLEVQPRWVELLEGVPRLRVLRTTGLYANMVAFNPARFSRSERAALVRALSNDEIRRLAFGDECAPPSHRPEIEPLPPGRPLKVIAMNVLDRAGAAVRRSLGPRGGEVDLMGAPELLALIGKADFDLAIIRPRISPPVYQGLTWRTGAAGNFGHYSSPAVDAAIDARDWPAVQRALEEDPPGVVVCMPPSIVVLDSRIRTPPYGSTGFIDSLPQWEVQQ